MPISLCPADRRRFLLASLGLLTLSLAACGTKPIPVSTGKGSNQTDGALPLVNALRAKHGLSALAIDPVAISAAIDQARRMANADIMNHNIGPGANFLTRMKGQNVGLPAAENIASGQDSVERAVTAWINSSHHLENMLGNYKGLGVAVVRNPASGNKPYWSMILSN
jgi:uncharacterized protein YkwD